MIRDWHAKIQSGEKTAVAFTEDCFKAIEARDPSLHAFLTLRKEAALVEAIKVDERVKSGEQVDLLAGIPGGIKDNIVLAHERATAGSKILDNYISPYDAGVVEKLRKVGAVIVGKTNLDEFALGSSTEHSAYGPTKNPVDETRVPGGTSGGSAAAVAAGMVPWALGSDTGGSIRQPAAFTGVYGLKPTYGRVSRSGLIAAASSLDQIGPMATCVEDIAIVLSRIAGIDPLDGTAENRPVEAYEEKLSADIKGKKIGIPEEYFSEALNPVVKGVADNTIDKLRSLGAEIIPISLPNSRFALPAYYIIQSSELSSNLARFDGIRYGLSVNDGELSPGNKTGLLETYLDTRRVGLGPEAKRRVMMGTYTLSAGYYDAYYKKAFAVRELLREEFRQAFEKVDAIFSPTTPGPAFKLGEKTDNPIEMYLSDIYTVTANLVGVPALSFPMGTMTEFPVNKFPDTKGTGQGQELPLGGQFMGKWFDEQTLLNLAFALEQSK